MTTLPNLPVNTWDAGISQPDELYNDLLSVADALVPTPVVADKDLNAPPGSPALGSLYIVGPSPTGAWAGHAGELVAYTYANAWKFIPPKDQWLVRVADEDTNYRYDGSAWVEESSGGGGIPDAPSDGTTYGRKDGEWVDVGGAVAGVSDVNGATGSITLAPGTNVTVVESPSGTFTINATGGGGGGSVPWKDFVDDYGADPTFTNDCGPAWDSFITDVEANGSMALRMVGHFKFSRALQNTSAENAQMPLPSIHYVSEAPRTIVLFSDAPACPTVSVIGAEPDYAPGLGIVESTLASGSGNLMAAFGPSGSFNNISNIHVVIHNVVFRTKDNPTISALNLENAACVDLHGVMVDTGNISLASVTYPTTSTSYGLKLPKNGNGANTMLGTVDVVGFYNGYSFGEHTIGLNVKAWGCINAFNFLPADHASTFVRMMAVHCNYGIVGPATGAHVLNIQQFDVEHTGSGSYAFVKDVSDAADTLYGYVNWRVVLAGVGGNYNFIVDGAHNFDIKPLAGFPKAFTVSGTNYTAGYWDADRIALFTNASTSTWVIPTDASVPFKIGTILTAIQMGAGQITVDGTAVTPRIPDSYTSRKQYAEIQLVKVGTNEWVLAGDYT